MIIGLLFFIALFITGLYLLWLGLGPFIRYTKAKKWVRVSGKITQVFSNNHWFNLDEQFEPSDYIFIRYEFTYDSQLIKSTVISLEKNKSRIQNEQDKNGYGVEHLPSFIKKLKRNPDVSVWVNPKNVYDSTLIINRGLSLMKVILGGILIIWSLGITKLVFNIGHIELHTIILEKKSTSEIERLDLEH